MKMQKWFLVTSWALLFVSVGAFAGAYFHGDKIPMSALVLFGSVGVSFLSVLLSLVGLIVTASASWDVWRFLNIGTLVVFVVTSAALGGIRGRTVTFGVAQFLVVRRLRAHEFYRILCCLRWWFLCGVRAARRCVFCPSPDYETLCIASLIVVGLQSLFWMWGVSLASTADHGDHHAPVTLYVGSSLAIFGVAAVWSWLLFRFRHNDVA
jgi:hypothetical protein